MNSVPVLDTMLRDVRYALRMLRKTPAFTAIALLTLAIGVGVNTAVFTVVDALLLKSLPYPEPERLATLKTVAKTPRGVSTGALGSDGATFLALRDNATMIDVAAQGAGGWGVGVNMVAGEQAANLKQARISADFFKVLGVRPLLGREFSRDEDRPNGPAVAILSHDLWTRVFGARGDIVGSPIALRGEPYTVVGVMPSGFLAGSPVDVWTPLHSSERGEGGGTNYTLYARLHGGVSWEQASAEVNQIATPVFRNQFQRDATLECALMPLQPAKVAELRQPLLMLWGAVGVV